MMISMFVATVESILLYGAETWTFTAQQEKALDGVYTRMLRMALNVTFEDHIQNVDLYGRLPRLTSKLRERRMGLAGHCVHHLELAAHPLILWKPKHGSRARGGKRASYVDTLKRDMWGYSDGSHHNQGPEDSDDGEEDVAASFDSVSRRRWRRLGAALDSTRKPMQLL